MVEHSFDSSLTCDYCGKAAEKCRPHESCPERERLDRLEQERLGQQRLATAIADKLIAEAICRLIEADPHQWSSRPCQTCTAVSALIARNFGCCGKRQ